MPQPMYIPRRQNPWEAMLPQLIGNMLLSKMRHKQEMDLYDRRLEEQKLATEREKLWDLQSEKRKYRAEQRQAGYEMVGTTDMGYSPAPPGGRIGQFGGMWQRGPKPTAPEGYEYQPGTKEAWKLVKPIVLGK